MSKKIILAFFIILLLNTFEIQAQVPQISTHDNNPILLYDQAKKLYDKEHFASAYEKFAEYISFVKKEDSYFEGNAKFYSAVCALELFNNDAGKHFEDFLTEYPDHPLVPYVPFYQAKFYYRNKDYENAVKFFNDVNPNLISKKDQTSLHLEYGFSLFKLEKYKEAKQEFEKIKDIPSKEQPLAQYYYAYISYNEGDFTSALKEFEKLKDDKKFGNVVPVYICQIYLLQKKYALVISEGITYLDNDRLVDKDKLLLTVAEAYYYQKEYNQAAKYYKEAININSNLSSHHAYQAGIIAFKQKDFQKALEFFTTLSDLKEDSLGQNIAYHQGEAYLFTGDKLKAKNSFAFASKLNFDNQLKENALIKYAKLCADDNSIFSAIESLKELINITKDKKLSLEAKSLLGEILASSDDPLQAFQVLDNLANRSKNLDNSYQQVAFELGQQKLKNFKYDEALDYLKIGVKFGNSTKIKALSWFWLGEIEYKNAKYENASIYYKNFLVYEEAKQTPYYNDAYYNLGYSYYKQSSIKMAAVYFNQYLAKETNSSNKKVIDAKFRLADVRYLDKDYSEALKSYDAAMNNASIDEKQYALYQMGIIYGLIDDNQKLISTMSSLAKSYPNTRYADDALYAVAETNLNQKKYQEAIKTYNSLIYNYPKTKYRISAELSIGLAYINNNQEPQGIGVLKKLIKTYSTSSEAQLASQLIENSYIKRGLTDSLNYFYRNYGDKSTNTKRDSTLWNSVIIHLKKKDCKNIISSTKSYLESFPNGIFSTDAYFQSALCYLNNNNIAIALANLDVVVTRAPNSYLEKALSISASLYYERNNTDIALNRYKQLETVAENSNNQIQAQIGQVKCYFALNQVEEMKPIVSKIVNGNLATQFEKQEMQLLLGKLYKSNNNDYEAQVYLDQVRKTENELGAEAQYLVAEILFNKEDLENCEKSILELRDKFDEYQYWTAKGFLILSDVYVKYGNNFQAKAILESIIENAEDKETIDLAKLKLKNLQ